MLKCGMMSCTIHVFELFLCFVCVCACAGQDGDYFYVVEKGSFTVIVDSKPVSQIGEGSSFGELALLYNAPRQATIRSDTNAVVFSLDRESYRFILAQSTSNREKEIKKALKMVPLLAELTEEQLDKLSDSVEVFPYNAGKFLSAYESVCAPNYCRHNS